MQHFEGDFGAQGARFALVVGRFNQPITERLLEGALDCLRKHGVSEENIAAAWVPGAYEIPLTAKKLAGSKAFDAVICLGAVIRGETAHFEYVTGPAASGIMQAQLETGVPIIFSILTTETVDQAEARSGVKGGNLGFNGALTAMEMVSLNRQIEGICV